jgi:hypothetical protein
MNTRTQEAADRVLDSLWTFVARVDRAGPAALRKALADMRREKDAILDDGVPAGFLAAVEAYVSESAGQ